MCLFFSSSTTFPSLSVILLTVRATLYCTGRTSAHNVHKIITISSSLLSTVFDINDANDSKEKMGNVYGTFLFSLTFIFKSVIFTTTY